MTMRMTIKGDKQLRSTLRKLSNIRKASVDRAMQDALEPMKFQTEMNAMRLRQPGTNPPGGHLDQGVISVSLPQISTRTRNVWWVTFHKRARKIAHLVEFGTAPHAQPRRGIMHPGASPKPFFRPAFDSTASATLVRLGRSIQQFLFTGLK